MANQVLQLIVSIVIILIACELFTNSIEWLGHKLHLSEAATGSVLAAVGTAMPETMIPILALIFARTTEVGEQIGIGAILGAPFMLSTLAMFVGGTSIVICSLRGRREKVVSLDYKTIAMDLKFFLIVFILAFVAGFIHLKGVKLVIAAGLVACYVVYLARMLRGVADVEAAEPRALYLVRPFGRSNPNLGLVVLQVAISLGFIIGAARVFVHSVEAISLSLGVSTAVLSFLITPVATELPEKANSIIWYSRNQDTLAMGNVTGAMVFQSSVIVALGIILTSWKLEPIELGSVLLAIVSSSLLYLYLRWKRNIHAYLMMLGGVFYAAYVLYFFLVVG